MKPAAFAYARPETVEEALAVLSEHGHAARILAGGQSLAAMLNMRLTTPEVLVDISDLAELGGLTVRDGMIEIGAAVTQDAALRWPGLASQPLLGQVLPWVGHDQTRQKGTICGSLAHADPSAELPLVLALLGGEVVLRSGRGRRILPAAAFQTGAMQTDLAPDEILLAARFPAAASGTACAFREVGPRHGDFAIAAVAAVADSDGVALGVAGVGDTPSVHRLDWRCAAAPDEALNGIARDLQATNDSHAPAAYRRSLVRTLGASVIGEVRVALSRS